MTTGGEGARPKLARKARLRWDARENTYLLLSPERGLLLNATAAAVLTKLDGETTLAGVIDAVAAEFGGAPRETVAREAAALLATLAAKGLVEGFGA